jgi:hypothetical protein
MSVFLLVATRTGKYLDVVDAFAHFYIGDWVILAHLDEGLAVLLGAVSDLEYRQLAIQALKGKVSVQKYPPDLIIPLKMSEHEVKKPRSIMDNS